MNFLHSSLIAGAAFALIPILIHITGKRKPKLILFPALQFVQATRMATARGWNVKRWLLLILRVAMMLLLALALASPRVHQASFTNWITIGTVGLLGLFAAIVTTFAFVRHTGRIFRYTALLITVALLTTSAVWGARVLATGPAAPIQSTSGPVAAVFILDTSPNMDYRFGNQTRLEVAKEHAKWIVGKMDAQSMIAVLTGSMADRLQAGLTSAERSIDRLQAEGAGVSLVERVRRAVELLRGSDLDRYEIYVITDMSANAWQMENTAIKSMLLEGDPILLQIINVGAEKQNNWAIDQVRVSQDVVPAGGTIQIDASVMSAKDNAPQQIVLELLAENKEPGLPRLVDGKLLTPTTKVINRKIVDSKGQGEVENFTFQIDDVPLSTNNYRLRLESSDPLAIDDTYSITVEGIESRGILVVDASPKKANQTPVSEEAKILALMLDPYERSSRAISVSDFSDVDLKEVSLVAVYNPPLEIRNDVVNALNKFVVDGGGLILCLGNAIELNALASVSEQGLSSLLPGPIQRQTRRAQRDVFLENVDRNHPLWLGIGRGDDVPWANYPVYRHWDIDKLNATARPVASFTVSGLPAVIEDMRGQGRIITFTTPVSELALGGYDTWNELSTSPDPWAVFGMMFGTGRYLQSSADMRRNFVVSEIAHVQWNKEDLPDRFELFPPNGGSEQVKVDGRSIMYAFTRIPGLYRLRPISANIPDVRGFAVHLAVGATRLERVTSSQLDEILGEGSYVIAADRASLQQSIGHGRYGRNLTPFLMLVIAGLFMAEQAMSQNFYVPQSLKWMTGRA